MIRRIVMSLVFAFVVGLAFIPKPAAAAAVFDGGNPYAGGCVDNGGVAGFLGLKNWDAYLCKDSNGVPQFTDIVDVWRVAVVVVEDMIKIAGYLAVGFIIWGGIKYLKSQGEPGETTQARQIINNAVMGLIIVIISVAIVQFIANTFQ